MRVIGLTGPFASGKQEAADFLVKQGYECYKFSDVLKEQLRKKGVEATRENLIKLGNEMRKKQGLGVLAKLLLEKIYGSRNQKFVLDGIRSIGEVDLLRELPNFSLIGIDAPQELRLMRSLKRADSKDPKAIDALKKIDESDKAIGIVDCMAKADYLIQNDKDIKHLHSQIVKALSTLSRPSKDKYYLNIALAVSDRSTCLRRQYGAVIVNRDQIISAGYAGAPRGTPNCLDIGTCYRQEKKIPQGEGYDKCRSVHAEMNALIHASRESMLGGKMYLAGRDREKNNELVGVAPCRLCRRAIINAGIEEVIILTANGIRRFYIRDWIAEANADPFSDIEKSSVIES